MVLQVLEEHYGVLRHVVNPMEVINKLKDILSKKGVKFIFFLSKIGLKVKIIKKLIYPIKPISTTIFCSTVQDYIQTKLRKDLELEKNLLCSHLKEATGN